MTTPRPTSHSSRQSRQVAAPRPPRPPRVTLRDETDLLAVVPYMFGFHPEESLVMMLTGPGGAPMFARVSLPTTTAESEAACVELLNAAVVNRGEQAMLVAYTDDEAAATCASRDAAERLREQGVEVVLALRADGRRWYRLLPGPEDRDGEPYDLESHPITATGVVEGRVTHRTREQLAQSLLPCDPDLLDDVEQALAEVTPLEETLNELQRAARWLDEWVLERVRRDAPGLGMDADELARVVHLIGHRELHEIAAASMTRESAEAHIRLWTEVVVRCPLEHLAPAAGLLSLAAWLAGHGALAWCAIDRARQSDPDCAIAALVGQALEAAVPPTSWMPADRDSLSLLSG